MSLGNPAFRLILGDFNCRPSSWWEGNISTKEGINLESVSSSRGLVGQPNLVIDSGVHSSLHTNCHHQMTHCKLNLRIVPP